MTRSFFLQKKNFVQLFCAYSLGLYFFDESKLIGVKAVNKMLVKVTTVVNFIHILRAAFEPIFLHQKTTKPICNLRKA